MRRWFRHYAGMGRDEKLISAAVTSRQPLERVVWVYSELMESASEIDEGGRFEFDCGGAAYLLRCEASDLQAILTALTTLGRIENGALTKWKDYAFERPPSHEWAVLRTTVFHRDDFTCVYCGAHGGRLECDHVVPVSRGGSHALENLATACVDCNKSKGGKLLSEWRH